MKPNDLRGLMEEACADAIKGVEPLLGESGPVEPTPGLGEADMLSQGVALSFDVRGAVDGAVRLCFSEEIGEDWVASLLGGHRGFEDVMAQSVLLEVGNIVASGFCNSLADRLSTKVVPSPPFVEIGVLSEPTPPGVIWDVGFAWKTARYSEGPGQLWARITQVNV